MDIYDYHTFGGKNLIKEYISTLLINERRDIYKIRHNIILKGLLAFQELNTVYFLHACQKQKGKAEKFELEKAINRAKELDLKYKKALVCHS